MLQGEHSAILLTFIKLPFVIKIFALSNFEWPLKTSFTVLATYAEACLFILINIKSTHIVLFFYFLNFCLVEFILYFLCLYLLSLDKVLECLNTERNTKGITVFKIFIWGGIPSDIRLEI